MGNLCCCRTESPCGSLEERSNLLGDESKVTAVAVGARGPEGDDGRRKPDDEANLKPDAVQQVKQGPVNGEAEPNSPKENGPLQKEGAKTSKCSPDKGSKLKENSTRAQEEDKVPPVACGQAEPLPCTLNLLHDEIAAGDSKSLAATTESTSVKENQAAAHDKVTEAAEVKNPSRAETDTTREPVAPVAGHVDDEDTGSKDKSGDDSVAEPSAEVSRNNEALSVPNTQPVTKAAAACQVSSVPAVSQEVGTHSNRAVSEDSESPSVHEEADPEHTTNHVGANSGPGAETSGLNDSSEVKHSANTITEPVTADSADASQSSKSNEDEKPDAESASTSSNVENITQDNGEETVSERQNKDVDVTEKKDEMKEVKEKEKKEEEEKEKEADIDAEVQEEQQVSESESTDVKADEKLVTEKETEESSEDALGTSEEDLYRGAEELSASQANKAGPALETTLEDRCSLAPAVDILSYSEREWKGNTAKSALIRKGYKAMSQRFGSVRRVRGDNYCALRATLFQVLSHSARLPAWLQEDNITVLPKELEAQEGLISQWTFPGECLQGDATTDITKQLKGYMELLRNTWRAAVDCSSAEERQQLCERVFQGGEEELGLFEALKLLMLGRAVELHGCMQAGQDVPLFCWLLFARDSSDCPRSFLSNHLSHVGLSAGLEQVEMFLLGYALQCTIQVYRLYKADTEEFVTYYPDDHKDDWPSVCLVTEDDRHYNVPVGEAAEPEQEEVEEEEEKGVVEEVKEVKEVASS